MLLLGDPGTAKSQLLKFVEKVKALIRIYENTRPLMNTRLLLLRSTRQAKGSVRLVLRPPYNVIQSLYVLRCLFYKRNLVQSRYILSA